MKYLLVIIGILVIGLGVLAMIDAPTITQEIAGLHVVTIGAMFFIGGVLVGTINAQTKLIIDSRERESKP